MQLNNKFLIKHAEDTEGDSKADLV